MNLATMILAQDCVTLVVKFVAKNITSYRVTREGSYTGYWWVDFINEDEKFMIFVNGDIGGAFSITVSIENSQYYLWQFDKAVNNRSRSREENILFQLKILKQFKKNTKT